LLSRVLFPAVTVVACSERVAVAHARLVVLFDLPTGFHVYSFTIEGQLCSGCPAATLHSNRPEESGEFVYECDG